MTRESQDERGARLIREEIAIVAYTRAKGEFVRATTSRAKRELATALSART